MEEEKKDKEWLNQIINQIKTTKRIIRREDFEQLKNLSDEEQKYVASRLSRTKQDLILKYLQTLPEVEFEIPLSRKASMFPPVGKEEKGDHRPDWIAEVQEEHRSLLQGAGEMLQIHCDVLPAKERIKRKKEGERVDPSFPYLGCVRDMLYAFGDMKTSLQDTCKAAHRFVHDWLKALLGVDENLLTQATIQKLFPKEYLRMVKMKKELRKWYHPDNEHHGYDNEDLEYFSNSRGIDEILPDALSRSEIDRLMLEHTTKEEGETRKEEAKEGAEEGLDEHAEFMRRRAESLAAEDYQELVRCRAAGMLKRGRKGLCRWLGLSKELYKKKTLIDTAAFIVKLSLCRVVEGAIKSRSPLGGLQEISSPLTSSELQPLAEQELDKLTRKLGKLHTTQYGYQTYFKDKMKYGECDGVVVSQNQGAINIEISKQLLEDPVGAVYKSWEKLPVKQKDQYKMRHEAEREVKSYLKRKDEKGDYEPSSEYASHLKQQIVETGVKKINSKFFYKVFQSWHKRALQSKI